MTATAFAYIAVDRTGARRRGVPHAPSHADAYRQVAASGLTPVRLRAGRSRLRPEGLGSEGSARSADRKRSKTRRCCSGSIGLMPSR